MLIRLFIILFLAGAIFGGAYFAVHELYLKPQLALKADKEAPKPMPPVDPSLADFQQCVEIRDTAGPSQAVPAFESFLRMHPSSTKREEARDILGELNSAIFFSAQPSVENIVVVKPGDSLGKIATRVKMPLELIVHLNRLWTERPIQPGQKLIAFPTDFRLVLKQREQKVVVMNGEKFFRQYPVLSWPGKKPPVILAKQTARVREKVALTAHGTAPKAQSQEYFQAFHTIGYPIPGHSIFSQQPDSSHGMSGGIRLAQEHMSEIAVLLPVNAPVTLE